MAPDLFRALADPSRLSLLCRIAEAGRPMTVSEAAGCCPVDLSVVSRHLALLREAGVLESERRGKEVHYWIARSALVATLRAIADALESCCPPACCAPPPPAPRDLPAAGRSGSRGAPKPSTPRRRPAKKGASRSQGESR